MLENILGIVASYVYIFIILGTARAFTRFGKEASRKFIHIMVCNWWIIAMIFFHEPVWAAIVPASFVVLNYLSYRYGLFEAMERKEGKGDLGTVYYAISLLILALWTFNGDHQAYIGGIGIFAMGYGDGLAALIGKKFGKGRYKVFGNQKSLTGSAVMWTATFIATLIMLAVFHPANMLWIALAVSAVATLAEAVTPYGLDNLSVPLVASGLAYVLLNNG